MLYSYIMQIYIDQSGKVEETEKPTILAFSNGKQKSIFISAKDKQEIQKLFREVGRPNVFIYKTFAILIFFLIKDELNEIQSIIIDTEYIGYEPLIKNILIKLIRSKKKDFDSDSIHFQQVGKRHRCHEEAIRTFRREKRADKIIKSGEVFQYVL